VTCWGLTAKLSESESMAFSYRIPREGTIKEFDWKIFTADFRRLVGRMCRCTGHNVRSIKGQRNWYLHGVELAQHSDALDAIVQHTKARFARFSWYHLRTIWTQFG
jgi:hypothetical protein